MSNVLNRLHEADQPQAEQWFLRTDDCSVYGPVTIAVMRDWAAQSRVAPGDEVSPDGENWVRAETVPDLKMEWMAELSDGSSYGPFNVLAVPNLYKNGSIPAGASLLHTASGKVVKVAELLQSGTEENEPSHEPELDQEKEKQWHSLYQHEKKVRLEHEAELQVQIDQLRLAIADSETAIKKSQEETVPGEATREASSQTLELEHALTTLRRKHDALLEQSARKEKDFTDQIASLTAEMDDTRSAVEQMKNRNREYSEQVLTLESNAETARKELEGTLDQLKQLNDHYEQLKKESARQLEELDAQNEAFMSEKQALRDANLQMEEDRSRTQRLIEQLKENMSQSDGSAEQLQRKLAATTEELNGFRRQAGIETDNLKRKVAELERKLSVTADQLERSSGTISDKSAEVEATRNESASVQEKLSREIHQLQQSLKSQKDSYDAELSREKQKNTELAVKLDQAREDVKADSSILQQTREKISRLEHDLEEKEAAFSGDRQQTETALREAQDAGTAMAEKIKHLESQLANDATGLNRTISDLRAEMEQQTRENKKAEDAASEQIKTLKESSAEQAKHEKELENTLSLRTSELENIRTRLSDANLKTAALSDNLQKANSTINELKEKNQSLDVSLQNERTGMAGREQNLKDEVVLFRARIKELEISLGSKTDESEQLSRRVGDLEKQAAELASTLSMRERELQETKSTLKTGTEALRKTITEKDAAVTSLSEELLSIKQALQATESTMRSLQTDYRHLQEESTEREKELRAQVNSAAEQFSELRDSSDSQISGLQTTSNELRTKLETAQTDNRQITARLEDTLSRLAESERNSEKQKHTQDSRIEQLETLLEKKSKSLETVTANLNKTTAEASNDEHKLRTAIRMLDKRDIAGRKLINKLESDLKELEDTKRDLTRQNGTLIEEVKDAVAQLKLLKKQVEPLNRKVEAQEELLRHRLARPHDPSNTAKPMSPAMLTAEKLQILLQKTAIALPLRKLTIIISIVLLIVISISAVKRLSRPGDTREDSASSVLQEKIQSFIALNPDLSVQPASGPVHAKQPAKVNAWPGINVPDITVEYGSHEATLSFSGNMFSSSADLTDRARETILTLLDKHGAVLQNYRFTVTGLAENNYAETEGHALADYSLRILRADAVRKLIIADARIQPSNVSVNAGTQNDPGKRSVIISLSPLQ